MKPRLRPAKFPSADRSRRGRWMMARRRRGGFWHLVLFGNWWWNSEAIAKARQMIYKPPPLDVSLEPGGKLLLKMGDSAWHRSRPETVMTNLMPDHGHLMHLFLLREPGLDRFYHLHPQLVRPGRVQANGTESRSKRICPRSRRGAIRFLPTWCANPASPTP